MCVRGCLAMRAADRFQSLGSRDPEDVGIPGALLANVLLSSLCGPGKRLRSDSGFQGREIRPSPGP